MLSHEHVCNTSLDKTMHICSLSGSPVWIFQHSTAHRVSTSVFSGWPPKHSSDYRLPLSQLTRSPLYVSVEQTTYGTFYQVCVPVLCGLLLCMVRLDIAHKASIPSKDQVFVELLVFSLFQGSCLYKHAQKVYHCVNQTWEKNFPVGHTYTRTLSRAGPTIVCAVEPDTSTCTYVARLVNKSTILLYWEETREASFRQRWNF